MASQKGKKLLAQRSLLYRLGQSRVDAHEQLAEVDIPGIQGRFSTDRRGRLNRRRAGQRRMTERRGRRIPVRAAPVPRRG